MIRKQNDNNLFSSKRDSNSHLTMLFLLHSYNTEKGNADQPKCAGYLELTMLLIKCDKVAFEL